MRFMDDPLLEGDEAIALAYYIIQQALQENELCDELLVQLCSQTWGSPNPQSRERGWTLLSLALGAFSPSKELENYLLKLVGLACHLYTIYEMNISFLAFF